MRQLVLALALFAAAPLSASWTSHGPIGGQVTAFAVSPTDRRVIYAALPDGLFRTGDAGATWRNVSGPIVTPAAVVVSKADPNVVAAAGANGVFRSDDAGATWQLAIGLPKSLEIAALLADPRDPNVLYLGGRCYSSPGVYKSTDGGRSFALTTKGLDFWRQCVEHLTLDPAAPDHLFFWYLYQGDVYGGMSSSNGGGSWTRATLAPARAIVVSPKEGGRRFALGENALLTSTDGTSWSSLEQQQPGSITALAIDPNVPRLFLGTEMGAYRSGDGGKTWLPLAGAARDRINAIDFDPASGAAIIGTNLGLFRSSVSPWNDWTDLHIGDDALTIDQVAADPSNGDVYAVVRRALFRSVDRGTSWQLAAPPLPPAFPAWSIVVGAAHDVYAFTYRNYTPDLLKLRADGTAWDAVLRIGTIGIDDVVADPSVPGTLYAVNQSVSRTRDGGATWEPVPIPAGFYVRRLAVDAHDSNLLVIVATNGSFDSVFRSTDGGRTWSANRLPPPYWFIDWIVATSHPGDFFLAAGDTLVRSVDGGDTWSPLPKPPPGLAAPGGTPRNVLAVDRRDRDVIYVATDLSGVLRSDDGGRSWQSIRDGLPTRSATLAIDAANVLHAGTNARGVWELAPPPRRRAAGR